MGEHPRDGGVYILLPVEGFVPGRVPLVARRIALRPVTARDGLDDHEPSILAPHLFHERLVIGAVALVCREDVVPGRKYRLEREPPKGLEMGCRSPVARARGAVEVFDVAYRVELKEVDVVHAQAL